MNLFKPFLTKPGAHRGGGFRVVFLVLAVGWWLAGCGGAKQGQLPTAPVSGQVMYRGAPLTHGTIKFIPVQSSGEAVRVAYGTLDAEGRYRLGTYAQSDGAVLGNYHVTVEVREASAADEAAAKAAMERGVTAPPRAKSSIPRRYADPNTAGLSAHVVAGANTINFDLKE